MSSFEEIVSNQKMNYDAVLKSIIQTWNNENIRPKLLIHSCCAPCSTFVLETLVQYTDITIYFTNPNIHPQEEYEYRSLVLQKFIWEFNKKNNKNVLFIEDSYNPAIFFEKTAQYKDAPEGGKRCFLCYQMRLEQVAQKATELSYDYFATTLTISPKKNSQLINQLGFEIQRVFPVKYLPSDFKKNNGYQRSIQLCKEYNIYRQHYCGCIFAAEQQGIDLNVTINNIKQGIEKLEAEKTSVVKQKHSCYA